MRYTVYFAITCALALFAACESEPPRPSPYPGFPVFSDDEFVAEINSIIDAVALPLSDLEIAENFLKFGNSSLQDAQIILFGEGHSEAAGVLLITRLINQLASPASGKVLFLEGGKPRAACLGLEKIIQIFVAKHWNGAYQPEPFSILINDNLARAYTLRPKLNPSRIRFGFTNSAENLNCFRWDNESLHLGDDVAMSFWLRNQSMVDVMTLAAGVRQKIFVVAGISHLPEGDFRNYRLRPSIQILNLLFDTVIKETFADVDAYLSYFGKRYTDPTGFLSAFTDKSSHRRQI
jgi:hypothetical protein